jgi:hypothetical protein
MSAGCYTDGVGRIMQLFSINIAIISKPQIGTIVIIPILALHYF